MTPEQTLPPAREAIVVNHLRWIKPKLAEAVVLGLPTALLGAIYKPLADRLCAQPWQGLLFVGPLVLGVVLIVALMPILAAVGIDPGKPEVVEVHNVIRG